MAQIGQVGSEPRLAHVAGGVRARQPRYELRMPRARVYEIGPTHLRSGDPFGLFTDERSRGRGARASSCTRARSTLGDLRLPSRRPFGDERGGCACSRIRRASPASATIAPGDSLRRIDWNATARLGKMQSRVYDPTSSQHLLICLNTQTIVPAWAGVHPDVLERAIVVAASIARDAYDRRYTVGLLANSTVPDADRAIRIAPGRRAGAVHPHARSAGAS